MSLYDLELCHFCGKARHKHRNTSHGFVAWAPGKSAEDNDRIVAWAVAEIKLRRREVPNWENEGGSCGDQGDSGTGTHTPTQLLTTRPRD